MQLTNNTSGNYIIRQLKLPPEIEKLIDIVDPVYTFCIYGAWYQLKKSLKKSIITFSKKNKVDLVHTYIDGTKIEANANRYTWVWKKTCIRNRDKVFEKLSMLIDKYRSAGVSGN